MSDQRDDGGPVASLSMRDYFATAALQGMAADYLKATCTDFNGDDNWLMKCADSAECDPDYLVCDAAYQLADKMIEIRNKQ